MMNSRKNREKMARSLGVNDPSLVSQRGGRPNASSKTMRKISSLALDFDVAADLQSIETPTLVLAGETEHPSILSALAGLSVRNAALHRPHHPRNWAMAGSRPNRTSSRETLRAWFLQEPLPEGLNAVADA